jgi:transposase
VAAADVIVEHRIRLDVFNGLVKPHFTSQRCSACGHVDPVSRESQARFP